MWLYELTTFYKRFLAAEVKHRTVNYQINFFRSQNYLNMYNRDVRKACMHSLLSMHASLE